MITKHFKRVILYSRQLRANKDINDTLQHLVKFFKENDVAAYVDEDTSESFDLDLKLLARSEIKSNHDLLVVVGGDGSLLSAAKIAIDYNIPVIGINRGHLGFLTDIDPHDFKAQLSQVLSGKYQQENRHFLHMHIHKNDKTYVEGLALNDVVLSRGNETRLINFDVFINGQFVSHYRSDGLILATPTGSTAYALSAGGPIMHPNLNAIVIVPMFSHSLSSRPLVIDSQSVVELHICENNDSNLQISCDGNTSSIIKPGQIITIKKHKQTLHLLHPVEYHYYDTLRIKLGWGSTG